jgi:Domain of unknown function (DUF362)
VFRTFLAAFALLLGVTSARLAAQTPAPGAEPPGPPAPPPKSVVFSATDPASIDGFIENPEVTRRMVDNLLAAVTQERDPGKAWRTLVAPTDHVGIKVSTVGGRYFSTHHGVVAAILSGLEAAGIPRGKVLIWDRESENLREAGFRGQRGGVTVRAIDPPGGFDPKIKFTAPIFGRLIWGDLLFHGSAPGIAKASFEDEQFSADSHFAEILTHDVTKIINVAIFSDDRGCGIAGALYNATVPNVDNNRRFSQPGGPSSIIDLYRTAQIGPKVVLHILDGLVAQYAGGPAFNPNYAFPHRTLYASKDPVALDATALRLVERWRKEARLPAIGEQGSWLQEGEVMGLGHSAEDAIEVRAVTAAAPP